MLSAYRSWLQSELELLGNASHHAYAFGQANMAKRAIEELEAQLAGKVVLELSPELAERIALALESLKTKDESGALEELQRLLKAAT